MYLSANMKTIITKLRLPKSIPATLFIIGTLLYNQATASPQIIESLTIELLNTTDSIENITLSPTTTAIRYNINKKENHIKLYGVAPYTAYSEILKTLRYQTTSTQKTTYLKTKITINNGKKNLKSQSNYQCQKHPP